MELRIRHMTRDDLKAVHQMERRIFSDPWPKIALEEHLEYPDSGAVVVETGSRIIGYACWRIEFDDLHLTNLAVAPAYRRKSVARTLLAHILSFAEKRDCELVFLEVRDSNRAAREFYEKAGFAVIDRIPGYYEKPKEDAVIMALRLATDLGNR